MSYIDARNYYLEIAKGNITGHTYVHKFGEAPDFDTGDGFVTIWDGADDGNTDAMVYTYSATADIGLLSSSNVGDTQTVEIQGLLDDGTLSTQTFTLNGQTDVDLSATGTNFERVFRLKNTGATDFAGDVYLRTDGSGQASGVPSTANTVRLKCKAGENQTLMSIYTVPTGKTAYLDSFYSSTRGANRSATYDIHLVARPSGGVFQLKNSQELSDSATNRWQHKYLVPEKFSAGTDIEIRANVDTAASVCNTDASTAYTVDVHKIPKDDSLGIANKIINSRSVAGGETYPCPELIGQVLETGDTLDAVASTTLKLNFIVSGVEL
jgi:hypothetical protein